MGKPGAHMITETMGEERLGQDGEVDGRQAGKETGLQVIEGAEQLYTREALFLYEGKCKVMG